MTSLLLAVASVVSLVAIGWDQRNDDALVVYCASSVRPALEPVARAYEEAQGVPVSLQFGPSGGLESQVRLSGRGDLFVPAAADPFLTRLAAEGLVSEIVPIATQSLVLATRPGDERIDSIAALLKRDIPFGVCNEQAAAGAMTRSILQRAGLWEPVRSQSVVMFPTVTELAGAIRDGGRLRAGVIWDVTAQQFDLQAWSAPELAGSQSAVSIGVLKSGRRAAADDFARYLASEAAPDFSARGYGQP